MATEENKAIVRRFIHEAVIGGDVAVIDELCSPECINHAAVPAARHGTEGLKRAVKFSRAAQPDQRWTNEMVIAEGDLVVIHGVREATWQAESFRGIPTPKGKAIVEHWAARDDLGLMQQLGAIPTAG